MTKYRRDVFTVEMLSSTKMVIKETCEQMECELLEFGGEGDHIHLMVSVHPKVAVSNLVGKLKGKSSYMIRREYWEQVKNKLWSDHFWSPSYCVFSFGGASLDVVKKYIKNQKEPRS